jgi:hypothetical protein
MEEPVDRRVHVDTGRRSRGLRKRLQAVHNPSVRLPEQESRVLPGAAERGRDRGDAFGLAARRRLLDRLELLAGVALVVYVIYACAQLEVSWARVQTGPVNAIKFIDRLFPPSWRSA